MPVPFTDYPFQAVQINAQTLCLVGHKASSYGVVPSPVILTYSTNDQLSLREILWSRQATQTHDSSANSPSQLGDKCASCSNSVHSSTGAALGVKAPPFAEASCGEGEARKSNGGVVSMEVLQARHKSEAESGSTLTIDVVMVLSCSCFAIAQFASTAQPSSSSAEPVQDELFGPLRLVVSQWFSVPSNRSQEMHHTSFYPEGMAVPLAVCVTDLPNRGELASEPRPIIRVIYAMRLSLVHYAELWNSIEASAGSYVLSRAGQLRIRFESAGFLGRGMGDNTRILQLRWLSSFSEHLLPSHPHVAILFQYTPYGQDNGHVDHFTTPIVTHFTMGAIEEDLKSFSGVNSPRGPVATAGSGPREVCGAVTDGAWAVRSLALSHPSFFFVAEPPPAAEREAAGRRGQLFHEVDNEEVVGLFLRPPSLPYPPSLYGRAHYRELKQLSGVAQVNGPSAWQGSGDETHAFRLYTRKGLQASVPVPGFVESCVRLRGSKSVGEAMPGEEVVGRVLVLISGAEPEWILFTVGWHRSVSGRRGRYQGKAEAPRLATAESEGRWELYASQRISAATWHSALPYIANMSEMILLAGVADKVLVLVLGTLKEAQEGSDSRPGAKALATDLPLGFEVVWASLPPPLLGQGPSRAPIHAKRGHEGGSAAVAVTGGREITFGDLWAATRWGTVDALCGLPLLGRVSALPCPRRGSWCPGQRVITTCTLSASPPVALCLLESGALVRLGRYSSTSCADSSVRLVSSVCVRQTDPAVQAGHLEALQQLFSLPYGSVVMLEARTTNRPVVGSMDYISSCLVIAVGAEVAVLIHVASGLVMDAVALQTTLSKGVRLAVQSVKALRGGEERGHSCFFLLQCTQLQIEASSSTAKEGVQEEKAEIMDRLLLLRCSYIPFELPASLQGASPSEDPPAEDLSPAALLCIIDHVVLDLGEGAVYETTPSHLGCSSTAAEHRLLTQVSSYTYSAKAAVANQPGDRQEGIDDGVLSSCERVPVLVTLSHLHGSLAILVCVEVTAPPQRLPYDDSVEFQTSTEQLDLFAAEPTANFLCCHKPGSLYACHQRPSLVASRLPYHPQWKPLFEWEALVNFPEDKNSERPLEACPKRCHVLYLSDWFAISHLCCGVSIVTLWVNDAVGSLEKAADLHLRSFLWATQWKKSSCLRGSELHSDGPLDLVSKVVLFPLSAAVVVVDAKEIDSGSTLLNPLESLLWPVTVQDPKWDRALNPLTRSGSQEGKPGLLRLNVRKVEEILAREISKTSNEMEFFQCSTGNDSSRITDSNLSVPIHLVTVGEAAECISFVEVTD